MMRVVRWCMVATGHPRQPVWIWWNQHVIRLDKLHSKSIWPVLGTCATFSATAPLAQTKKGGARRSGAKVKNDGAVAVVRKK